MAIELEMSAFEQSTFGRWVVERTEDIRAKLHLFERWNRYDLAMQLREKLIEAGSGDLFPRDYQPKPGRQIGTDDDVPARLVVPRKPLANPKQLLIHRGSVAAFLMAEPGHAFTGIAMVGHVREEVTTKRTPTHDITTTTMKGRPKIFLCPVQQGVVTTRDTRKAYVPKQHAAPKVSVYKTTVKGAINHKASDVTITGKNEVTIGPGAQAGHTQLSNIVRLNKKYASLSQEEGHFVGFTVSKGVANGMWKNRYAMTSLSSNAGSFGSRGEDDTARLYPNVEWRDEIMAACDALLTIESDLESLGLSIPHVCEDILQYKSGDNEFWKSMRDTYWPCYNVPLVEATARDLDWD